MTQLANNKWLATTALRGSLTIVFILWLASVMSHYENNETEKNSKDSVDNPTTDIVIEELTLPPLPETKERTPEKPKQAHFSAEPSETVIEKALQSPEIYKQQIQRVYNQLSEQGVDIQIAWPHKMQQQLLALDFMYQCAGMQFSVLNGNNISKVNQFSLVDYSEWIRVAQGNLSPKEQHWLTAYELTGTPIRLFPRKIDFRLAQYLANALKGAPLINLRASYQVINRGLYLTKIQLNNLPITGRWKLYQGRCN